MLLFGEDFHVSMAAIVMFFQLTLSFCLMFQTVPSSTTATSLRRKKLGVMNGS